VDIISYNENYSRENSLCPIRPSASAARLCERSIGAQTESTLETVIAECVSDSRLGIGAATD
jgi:hypothetical protein